MKDDESRFCQLGSWKGMRGLALRMRIAVENLVVSWKNSVGHLYWTQAYLNLGRGNCAIEIDEWIRWAHHAKSIQILVWVRLDTSWAVDPATSLSLGSSEHGGYCCERAHCARRRGCMDQDAGPFCRASWHWGQSPMWPVMMLTFFSCIFRALSFSRTKLKQHGCVWK